MHETTIAEYNERKKKFFANHACENVKETRFGNMKYFNMEDGATWYEFNSAVDKEILGEVHGVPYRFVVSLYKTEYWSTDDGNSRVVYDKFDREELA